MISVDTLSKLTPLEFQMVIQLRLGLTNQEMADHWGVTEHTIRKYHLTRIYKKLGVKAAHYQKKRRKLKKRLNEIYGEGPWPKQKALETVG